MASVKGFDRAVKVVTESVDRAMRTTVKDYVIKHAQFRLKMQRDKTGEQMPEKAESTKRQYRRKGWNTEDFLVRTGKSTVMDYEWLNHVLTVYPRGQTILGYNVEKRTKWVDPTDDLMNGVNLLISEEIARALR